ncbi:discoidin domain-containing protein [Kribbella sp. NPDC020789]
MNWVRFRISLAALAVTAPLVLGGTVLPQAQAASTAATTYYVDADGGNDSAAGTSPALAWRSLAKVNAAALQPGDTVRFQGGDTWHGGLRIHTSGAAGAPITVTSYGTGRPVIAGDTTVDAAVLLDNVHHVQVSGLEVTNGTDLSVSKATTYRGIFAIAKDTGEMADVAIVGNYVHSIDGKGGPVIGKGGITVGVRGNSTPTWYSGLRVEGNEVADVNAYGISTFTTWCASCEIYPAETGIPVTEVSPTRKAFTGAAFVDNYVHDVTAGGITPQYIDDALVEGNTVDKAGAHLKVAAGNNAGIWWQGTNRITVQYNVVRRQGYDSFRYPDPVDGMAFDADMGSSNSTVQYNYSDSNAGGFFMCLISASNVTLRYNVSRHDFYRPFSIWSGCWNLRGHNNTIWGTADTITRHRSDGTTFQQGIEAFARHTEPNGGNLLYNNIFYNPGRGAYQYGSDPVLNFSHNLYWDPTGSPLVAANDPAAVVANPQLVNPDQALPEGKIDRATLLQVLGRYAPAAGSPARNAGVSASTAPRTDALGTQIPGGAPDLGAVQHAVVQSASTTLGTTVGSVANVADGNESTSWASADQPAVPGSLTVQYGEARPLDALHVGVAFGQGQGPTSVDVQTEIGGTWVTQVSGRSLTWSQNTSAVEWQRIPLPAVTATGVRLVVRSANLTWGHVAINELRVAKGGVAATTNGDYAGTNAQNAVDGVPTTPWGSSGSALGRGLQVDPGAPQTVKSVTLSTAFGQGQGPTTVRVQALKNGVWTQVLNATTITWSSNTSAVESRTLTLPTASTGTTFYVIVDQANLTWGHYAIYEVALN